MIWNDALYVLRLSPVMRRATSGADSPRRRAWQTGGGATAGVGAADSIATIGSAHWATRVNDRKPHLIRSRRRGEGGGPSLKPCASVFVSHAWAFGRFGL